jgi:hypothetical protein
MAGTEKRRSTKPRNTARMGLAATADSTSEWRELGAQVIRKNGITNVAKALWDGALSLDHILAYKKI